MAAWAAVVSRSAVALCSRLAPGDCHGSHQFQQQLANLRHSSMRMCGSSTTASPRGSSEWGGSSSSSSRSSSSSGISNIGVAGVEAETSDEVAGNKTRIRVGQVAVQGLRDEMEDDVSVLDGPLGFTYAAVFDGHAGFSAAQFLRDELFKECVDSLEGGTLLESNDQNALQEAFSRAFNQTDKRLLSCLESDSDEKDSGSTATVLFMDNDSVTVAHVGDSRAVLARAGKTVDLSADHRPYGNSKTSVAEINRIKQEGGWITNGRLCATLSVSRAFGNICFKTQKEKMLEEGIEQRRWTRALLQRLNLDGNWLSVTPDVHRIQLDEDAEFIILASDGLWDIFKSNDAVKFIRKELKQHGDAQRAAEAIARATLERHGQDNISVIILDLGKVIQEEAGLKWW